jgi:hypothetical protein
MRKGWLVWDFGDDVDHDRPIFFSEEPCYKSWLKVVEIVYAILEE